MKIFYFVILFVLIFSTLHAELETKTLFRIERNKNKNQVLYDIRLDSSCRPEGSDPVIAYWHIFKNKDGKEEVIRSDLNFFDKRAYGIVDQKVNGSSVVFSLKALPSKRIEVTTEKLKDSCNAKAYLEISGQKAILTKIYVFAVEGMILPSVKYIDIFGDLPDGKRVEERITP